MSLLLKYPGQSLNGTNCGRACANGEITWGEVKAAAQHTFRLATPDLRRQFFDYLATGVDHIWSGYDHILLLLSLLLPAVVVHRGRSWEPSEGFGSAFAMC